MDRRQMFRVSAVAAALPFVGASSVGAAEECPITLPFSKWFGLLFEIDGRIPCVNKGEEICVTHDMIYGNASPLVQAFLQQSGRSQDFVLFPASFHNVWVSRPESHSDYWLSFSRAKDMERLEGQDWVFLSANDMAAFLNSISVQSRSAKPDHRFFAKDRDLYMRIL